MESHEKSWNLNFQKEYEPCNVNTITTWSIARAIKDRLSIVDGPLQILNYIFSSYSNITKVVRLNNK